MKTKLMTMLIVAALSLSVGCAQQTKASHGSGESSPYAEKHKPLTEADKKLNTGLGVTLIPLFLLIGL